VRILTLYVAASLACVGSPALAQTFGPPIAGMCLLSRTGAINASRAGQSVQLQLKQMQSALSSDLARQRASIDQQLKALESRQNTTAPIEYQRQQSQLRRQAQLMEQGQDARFIAAQTRGQQQLDQSLNTALARVVTRTVCSIVLDRDSAYGWNNSMDITPHVTREMDGLTQSVLIQ
jgi:Skp family chaperone for outer membrane proteins